MRVTGPELCENSAPHPLHLDPVADCQLRSASGRRDFGMCCQAIPPASSTTDPAEGSGSAAVRTGLR